MVKLGRVRIDDNFGLVQRYRSFLRCRQSAFYLQATQPPPHTPRRIRPWTQAPGHKSLAASRAHGALMLHQPDCLTA